MKRLLPLLFFAFAFSANAQDYELFPNPSDTLAFKGQAGNVLFMRFDSIDIQSSQTIYWPHKEVHFSGQNGLNKCWAHQGDTSWFGYKITHDIILDEYLFECDKLFFSLKPSISSYNADSVGWMNYDGDTVKLLATSTGKFQKMLFNNQVDSVIRTEIKFVSKSGNILFSYPDSIVNIEVSKANGVQSFPFLQTKPMYYHQVISGNRNHERIDYHLLSRGEIFDFQIGDEFHYFSQYKNLMGGPYGPPIYINHKIIGVQYPKSDSVIYLISEKTKTYQIDPVNMTSTVIIQEDTISRSYGRLNDLINDNLSFESYPNMTSPTAFWLSDSLNQSGVHIIENFFVDTGGTCLMNFLEPYYSDRTYIKKFGVIWEEYYNFPGYYYSTLIYAQKTTGQTYGRPHHINLKEVAFENQLKIYPNPTSDNLNIELPDEIQSMKIVIIDQLGRKLIEQSINRENQSIPVENLTPGTYFIKTESGKAIPFVKQ